MPNTGRGSSRRACHLVALGALMALAPACKPSQEVASPAHEPPTAPAPVRAVAAGEAIRYAVSFPEPHTHYAEVEAHFPTSGDALTLSMASWTPGSYKIRDYARNVEALAAFDDAGERLPVEKIAKHRWRVQTGGAEVVAVTYRIWCREMSVRTNWVEPGFAMLNGAPTFLTDADNPGRPHAVRLTLPDGWEVATGLERDGDAWIAPDYEALVDSPIVAGDLTRYDFEIDGVGLSLVNRGEPSVWDGPRSAADVEAIARAQIDFWGTIPFERYVFLNLIDQGGGGLEHRNSTLMMANPWRTRDRATYIKWLGLVSHEFFHTWNVKRLRPAALGPFGDGLLGDELHTRSLWIAEGLTAYYDDLLLRRAGLIDDGEYLAALSGQIQNTEGRPGGAVRSLSESSFDAWIKHYQPDGNTNNTSANYYGKGAVVGFLLDAEIRRLTGDTRSLDDVMRAAWGRYSGETGYTPEQFRALASEVAGADLSGWFEAAVDGTGALDYDAALSHLGLKFTTAAEPSGRVAGWLGASVSGAGGRAVITGLKRGTPAYGAGLDIDDELVAVDGWRVDAGSPEALFGKYIPGDEVNLTVSRRGRLQELTVTLGRAETRTWTLAVDDDASAAAAREAWLQR